MLLQHSYLMRRNLSVEHSVVQVETLLLVMSIFEYSKDVGCESDKIKLVSLTLYVVCQCRYCFGDGCLSAPISISAETDEVCRDLLL